MTDPRRAERLWLALAVAMLWMVSLGSEIEVGAPEDIAELPDLQRLLGSTGRKRCLRLFRLGWLWLLALLQARAASASSPPPSSVSSPLPSSPPSPSLLPSPSTALAYAQQALTCTDAIAYHISHVFDYVRAHWLLGAAHLAGGDLSAAERHLGEALTRCRGINAVMHEPDILLELARLRLAQGNPAEAQALAAAAQGISERSGYAPKEADARLVLARLAQQAGNAAEARQQAEAARRLATCDGPPAHTYYAAYVEAEALVGAG